MLRLNVNGKVRDFDAEPDTPLLWVLREQLALTGTKYGCGVAACGACTVHVDGEPMRSCQIPVESVGKAKISTIEGMAKIAPYRSFNSNRPVRGRWWLSCRNQPGPCITQRCMT